MPQTETTQISTINTGFSPTIPAIESGSYPVRPGNRAQLWIDGIPAFGRICAAIEAATSRVWVTVTFMWAAFEMPGGRGTALDVLDRAAARGVDVRVLFWRPDDAMEHWKRNAFWGSDEQIQQLESRGSGIRIRWDRAAPGFCQHQKSWLIDDGNGGEIAFVGGINLNPHSVVAPGHSGEEQQNHDLYVEIAGLATVDIHHNFVQRWNEASERLVPQGHWGEGSETDLPFPTRLPRPQGDARIQIQRTIHAGCYTDSTATPEGLPFAITSGERSIFDQYIAAIDAAERTIYLENQYVTVPEIVDSLHRALQRGVEVLLLLPAEPDTYFRTVIEEQPAFHEAWMALGEYKNFILAGIAGLGTDSQRKPVYVHSKMMLVDDLWATVGSCNLHRYSLLGNGEMNTAIWSPESVKEFRCALFQEHLGRDTSGMDDRAAFHLAREVAQGNRVRFEAGDPGWQGLMFALDLGRYG